MTKRTVKIALIAYQGVKQGHDLYGLMGQEVDVNDDDLERFDELNGTEGPDEAEAFAAQVANTPTGPTPLDNGISHTAEAESGELEEPRARDPLADWQDYAEQEGVSLEHEDGSTKTKKELISELTGD